MNLTDLSCIRCGKGFPPAVSGPVTPGVPPSGGIVFRSSGNYGSRLYDEPPGSREYILIAVCDGCTAAAGARGDVLLVVPPLPGQARYERWQAPPAWPEEEEEEEEGNHEGE